MPTVNKVEHIYEPNPLACGQAVLAMLSGQSVEEIFKLVKTEKETTLKDMKEALKALKINFKEDRIEVKIKKDLPKIAILSLETLNVGIGRCILTVCFMTLNTVCFKIFRLLTVAIFGK